MEEVKARMMLKMKEGAEGVAAAAVALSLQKATKGRNDSLINTTAINSILVHY